MRLPMEPKDLPRRERDKLRQRREMISAALELFSVKGYHNVSMQEIARKAEFAIGTLYNFFKSKEDLYKAIMLEKSEGFYKVLIKTLEEPDDEIEKLRNYTKAKGELFRADVALVRLYFAGPRGSRFDVSAVDAQLRERYYRFIKTLTAVFEEGMRRKRFNKIAAPGHLAIALDSLINSLLLLWVEAPERHPYPEDPGTILDIFLKGLVGP
jgi:TetR/AcrR family transcriptional regulator